MMTVGRMDTTNRSCLRSCDQKGRLTPRLIATMDTKFPQASPKEGGPSAEGEGDDEGGVMNGDDTRTRKSNVKNLLLLLSLPVVCRNGPMLVYVN